MPDAPPPKATPHPLRLTFPPAANDATPRIVRCGSEVGFAELCTRTNFTFLTGASHPHELAVRAAELGYHALGIADTNTLAGVVRAHVAAKKIGLPLRIGCRLVLQHPVGLTVVVYPTDAASYARLCTLLTLGKRRAAKAQCHLTLHDLLEHRQGLVALLVPPPEVDDEQLHHFRGLRQAFAPKDFYVTARVAYGPDDRDRLRRHADLAEHLRCGLIATNDALYHVPERRPLHDVVTCIRHGCTLDAAGYRLQPHAERHLKPPEEMARLFANYPQALANTLRVAERNAGFDLDQIRYQYPHELVPADTTAMQHLTELAHAGVQRRFGCDLPGAGVPPRTRDQFLHELDLIAELGYAHYFLTVEDMVRFARSRGILCQGRGAAANSVVCYCLSVTDADPRKINTLFERFVSRSRDEPPDIDIDFEHQRREEVIQYLYRKYGRHRAALTAEVITYRGRSAVREVGKTLGLSLDTVDRLAKGIDWWHGGSVSAKQLRELKLDSRRPAIQHLVRLANEIQGFPRHLGQHVGGFVLTQSPLSELVPIENAAMADRTVIEWDKDDIDALGILKVDVLGLGMLSVLRRGYDLLKQHRGIELSIADTPADDAATYDMICAADTVGVFQIESRAQMSMLPRLRPRAYYDLVIEVAIVRPGPIQGQMVHPYLRRRRGEEPVDYPDEKVKRILGKTLGVPLFQEQAMQLAIECAGFTPDEADALRRAVTGFKHVSAIQAFGEKIVGGMLQRGYDCDFAERCFKQIQGFSTYGFPESHAASFALLAYASSYLKCHHPAVFCCALLNSQPMGFYAPAQLVQDAQRHGVEVRPVDVHHSEYDCTLEPCDTSAEGLALRLGFNRVQGLREDDARLLIDTVERPGNFRGRGQSVETLWRDAGCSAGALRRLAAADAFHSMGLDRQSALWHARKLKDAAAPLFTDQPPEDDGRRSEAPEDQPVALPELPPLRHIIHDYAATGVTLRPHPISFLRPWLACHPHSAIPAERLADEALCPQGKPVAVAGICLVRQRPGSAKNITFMTLEDETGTANLVVYPHVFDRHLRVARHATAMLVHGTIDRQGPVVHVKARRFTSLDDRVADLRDTSRNFH